MSDDRGMDDNIFVSPPPLEMMVPVDHSMANTLHNRIEKALRDFEESLGPEEELGGWFTSFNGGPIHIESIGYYNPSIIAIYGHMASGDRITILQHMTQLSLALVAVKAEHQPAHRIAIGFKPHDEEETP